MFLTALRETLAGRLYHYYPAKLSYLLLVSFVGAGLLCALDGVPYLAALYQSVSAITGAGLVSIDISTLSTGSQVVLFIAIVGGSPVLGSTVMPLTRWWNARAALAAHVAAVARSPPRSARAKHQEHQMMAARTLLRDALLVGALIVLAYWAAVQLALFTVLAAYSSSSQGVRSLLAARGVSPLWFSTFHAASTFSNSGLTLFTDNLVAFAEDRAVLLTIAFAIPLGNVAAPLALRCVLCAAHALAPRSRTLDFLVRHPRVAFYNVFDAPATLQLAAWVALFTVYQFVSFLATDFGKSYLAQYSQSSHALIALFSAVSTRTAGFNVVNMIDTSVSQQVVCATLMYLSATPLLAALALSRKQTSASPDTDQLESSLLVCVQSSGTRPAGEGEGEGSSSSGGGLISSSAAAGKPASLAQGLLSPLHSVLPYDSLFAVVSSEGPLLLLVLLLMCYAEDTLLSDPAAPRERSVFGIAFELASAYGTSGLTLSPNALSTSAYFSTFSKLLIMAVMLAGRMRGLPLDVDELSRTHRLWEREVEEGEQQGSSGSGSGSGSSALGEDRRLEKGKHSGAEEERGQDGDDVEEDEEDEEEGMNSFRGALLPHHSLEQQQQQQQQTVNDGHAFTVGVQLLLGERGGPQRKSMRSAFSHVPEGNALPVACTTQVQASTRLPLGKSAGSSTEG
jgi:Trk-type K+ transport system membrane component